MDGDLTILNTNDPEAAKFINSWRQKYERVFDMNSDQEKANFYEGVLEMARYMASQAKSAKLKINPDAQSVGILTAAINV